MTSNEVAHRRDAAARQRAERRTAAKRPAQVLDARLLPPGSAVRHGSPAPGSLTFRQRYALWAQDHYVGDQVVRVCAVLVTAVAGILTLGALVAWAVATIIGGVQALTVGGGLAFLLVLSVAAVARRRHPRGGHSGSGWHYTKCR